MPLNRKARFALPALIDREDEENIFFRSRGARLSASAKHVD